MKRLAAVRLAASVVLALAILPASGLTLSEALKRAVTDHPSLALKRHAAEALAQDLKASEWQRYPTLTVEGSSRLATTSDTTAASSTVVRLDQPLWSAGRISKDIEAAQRRFEASQLAIRETEQDLMLRTISAYCEVWRWTQRVSAARLNAQEHERLYQMIRRRADQEVSSEIDAALAQARWQQAQTEQTSFEASLTVARSALQQLIGHDDFAADDFVLPESAPVSQPMAALQQAALDASPTLRRIGIEAQQAQAEASVKAAAPYPTVAARLEHAQVNGPNARPYDQASIVLLYQPGAGLSALNTSEAARRRLLAAQDAITVSEREVSDKLRAQLAEAQSLASQRGGLLAYARSMANVKASYLRQYTVGRKSWLEVLNAQRDLALSEYGAQDVLASLTAARLKLDILTGLLTHDTLFAAP